MDAAGTLTPSLARAVGHPLRVRIIAALDDGPRSLPGLASLVQADQRAVARHARVLEHAGLVARSRSGRGVTYRLASMTSFSDEEYGAIAGPTRQAGVAAALAHCHTAAVSALENGGFDRSDVHLSRTSVDVTEEQWRRLTSEFADLLDRIDEVKAEEDDSSAPVTRASAVLMLFERSASGESHSAAPDEDHGFSLEEGLERSWGLSEEIEGALNGETVDWATVVALADRLRVVARAALADELRSGSERSVGAAVRS